MQAVVTGAYGGADVLCIMTVEKPQIEDNEILVEVHAASVNPLDWKIRSGELKMMTGKTPPRILGSDYAGIVHAVGAKITGYTVGDKVFGLLNGMKVKDGTYAEYVKVTENDICIMPAGLEFTEAAALPMVAVTAYKALTQIAAVRSSASVLINGCTGGVGGAALQIARALGCKTTGICRGENGDLARNLGADEVIDYKRQDVFGQAKSYDVIFDPVGNLAFSRARKILNRRGTYVTTQVTLPAMIFGPLANAFRSRKSKLVMVTPDKTILGKIKALADDGALQGQIARVFPLEQVQEAHRLSEKGGFQGKLILKTSAV